jgi:hypothetical protein
MRIVPYANNPAMASGKRENAQRSDGIVFGNRQDWFHAHVMMAAARPEAAMRGQQSSTVSDRPSGDKPGPLAPHAKPASPALKPGGVNSCASSRRRVSRYWPWLARFTAPSRGGMRRRPLRRIGGAPHGCDDRGRALRGGRGARGDDREAGRGQENRVRWLSNGQVVQRGDEQGSWRLSRRPRAAARRAGAA